MKVLELMRVHVNTIGPEATLPDAVDIMDLYQVVTVPVVDEDGFPLGVVTESDIEDQLLVPFEAVASEMPSSTRDTDLFRILERARVTRIREIMSTPAVCVDEHAEAADAAALMISMGYKRIPVTSNGKVIGTIGRIDVCQGFLDKNHRPDVPSA